MTERRPAESVQTVVLQPGQSVVIEAAPIPRLSPSEVAKKRRIEALAKARVFFHENAEDIAFLMGGGVEDRDRIQLNSGGQLREVTEQLIEAGVSTDQVVSDVQRSLLARPGMIDSVYAFDTARSYGRILLEEEERIIADRIAQDAAPKPPVRRTSSARS